MSTQLFRDQEGSGELRTDGAGPGCGFSAPLDLGGARHVRARLYPTEAPVHDPEARLATMIQESTDGGETWDPVTAFRTVEAGALPASAVADFAPTLGATYRLSYEWTGEGWVFECGAAPHDSGQRRGV